MIIFHIRTVGVFRLNATLRAKSPFRNGENVKMPTNEQKLLIELLAGEISGETRLGKTELKAVDWAEVLKEAKAQAVSLMAAEGAVKYR